MSEANNKHQEITSDPEAETADPELMEDLESDDEPEAEYLTLQPTVDKESKPVIIVIDSANKHHAGDNQILPLFRRRQETLELNPLTLINRPDTDSSHLSDHDSTIKDRNEFLKRRRVTKIHPREAFWTPNHGPGRWVTVVGIYDYDDIGHKHYQIAENEELRILANEINFNVHRALEAAA